MRRILDAKDYRTNEPVYLKGHAKATYMSNGMSVEELNEDALTNLLQENGWKTKDLDNLEVFV